MRPDIKEIFRLIRAGGKQGKYAASDLASLLEIARIEPNNPITARKFRNLLPPEMREVSLSKEMIQEIISELLKIITTENPTIETVHALVKTLAEDAIPGFLFILNKYTTFKVHENSTEWGFAYNALYGLRYSGFSPQSIPIVKRIYAQASGGLYDLAANYLKAFAPEIRKHKRERNRKIFRRGRRSRRK